MVGPQIDLRHAAKVTGDRAFLGDYQGTAATADAVHLAWCVASFSSRHIDQTLWSATVVR